ncbi:uncharacterized protein LOC109857290 [Pseudomyrmex gracilis]|uniref:uncharacterized protein LOC109857290 n=1 Tax=Pseudomyrmex gracilis TaxID=219809 RepID=UPI00099510C0|nr:uncharacterized protein LOC109857290 [Pseudomyrmex gracilis]
MSLRRSLRIPVYLAFVVAIAAVAIDVGTDECDKTKCRGPLEYYRVLGCEPVYDIENDCCPIKYNCDRVRAQAKNKCYVNGKEYDVGEKLKPEDSNPCDFDCACQEYNGIASFICAGTDCAFAPLEPNCFRRPNPSLCCGGNEKVCLDNLEKRATCVVDGITYKDGEYFDVKNETDKTCVCRPGYEGENVEPFCYKHNRPYCSPGFYYSNVIHENCAPIFYNDQPPQTSCSLITRCQEENDTVIHKHDLKSGEVLDEENVCLFGNLTMHLGDEISQSLQYFCIKCVCEVPPIPTCQHLPPKECNYVDYILSEGISGST